LSIVDKAGGEETVGMSMAVIEGSARETCSAERFEGVVELLGDDYACRLVVALSEEPMPAVELAEECEMSRPTVYRRLNRLADHGLVSVCSDGEHGSRRKQYCLKADELELDIGSQSIDIAGRIEETS
jgi:predicted transcriptional regulator